MENRELTVTEKLLRAAQLLETSGRRPFTAEDLVVAAWQEFPEAFSLRGYDHPDSNRIFAEIMGSKPLRKRGYIQKVGEKTYQLTELGREVARVRTQSPAKVAQNGQSLDRSSVAHIKRLLASRAYNKLVNGDRVRINFSDACSFLGISAGSTATELEARKNAVKGLIEMLLSAIAGGRASFRHGDSAIARSQANDLLRTLEFILTEFDDDLSTIRKRKREK